MANNVKETILPALQRYFSRRARSRLRTIALWGDSFEEWIQWECVFALTRLMRKMKGNPWDYEQWFKETGTEKHPILGRRDMYFGGEQPLWVELKACVSCRGFKGNFIRGKNKKSLNCDIANVQRVKHDAAVCLLFAIEHPGVETPTSSKDILRKPDVVLPRWVDLGNVWCEKCEVPLPTTLALYGWMNRAAR